jgi:3-hydroxyacyl-CoA dehydrogenase
MMWRQERWRRSSAAWLITPERRDAALKNISAATDPRQAAREIDLLSESVPEDPKLKKNADFVKTYVDRGWLGLKSGHGFYTYPNPAFQRPDFIAATP